MGLYWKSHPGFNTRNMELKFEFGPWVKTILNCGSEYPMERFKYVVDSNQDNTEIPADPQEDQVPQTIIKVVAARSKAKAKPQPRELVGTTATIPMHERRLIDIEPSEPSLAAYEVSKKVISLLRHNQTVQRGRRWSNSILENQVSSSKSILTSTALVR